MNNSFDSAQYKNKVQKRFDALSSEFNRKSIPYFRNKRAELIAKYLSAGDKVLEIGCGSGNLMSVLDHGSFGLDLSFAMICECRKIDAESKLLVADAEKLPIRSSSFDKVVLSEVLYYLPDFQRALGEVARILNPQGLLLLTSLNGRYNFIKNLVGVLGVGIHDGISLPYPYLSKIKNALVEHFTVEEVVAIPLKYIAPQYSPVYFIAARKRHA